MLGERVLHVWRWYLHRFRRYRKKTRGGARNSSPSGARVKDVCGIWSVYSRAFFGAGTMFLYVAPFRYEAWASKAGGRGGRVPRSRKISGGRPPRNDDIFASFFLHTDENFAFSTIFKIKWPKSEEKQNFGGKWIWVPIWIHPPKQNFVATWYDMINLIWSYPFAKRTVKL